MNKNKKLYIIIIFLLLALGVCISISFTRSISEKKNNSKDIINIECNDKDCKKEIKKKNKSKDNNTDKEKTTPSIDNPETDENNPNNGKSINGIDNNSNNSNGNNENIVGTEDSNNNSLNVEENFSDNNTITPEEQEELTVSDTYQTWKQETELKIFNVDKIAPGYSGAYDFIINNNTKKNVKYNITLNEINEYNVNMLYKLKRNGEYIAGNNSEWVKYSNLNLGDKVLNDKKNDAYTIEWKWVDAENDTIVGRTKGAKYKLEVLINAAETDEFDKNASAVFNPDTGDKILYFIEIAIISLIALILLIILKRRQKD